MKLCNPLLHLLLSIAVFLVTQAHSSDSTSADFKDARYATSAEIGLMLGFPPPVDKRVDQSNAIFGVPYNRWSYQNMRRLYPSAAVRGAKEPTHLVRKIDPKIEALSFNRADNSPSNLVSFLTETYTDAFMVLHKGEVVFERYLNGMTADAPHQMMSVTKSFAGLLALLAESQGLLREEDLVTKWVPELNASGAFNEATVGQVLNMTNSTAFSENYSDPDSDIQQYGRVLGLIRAQPDEQLPDNLYDYLVTLKKGPLDHGAQYEYQTPKADVLNWLTNRATGLSFEENLAESLWIPLGADGETYVLLDKNGNLFAGGGLNASPNNLARFAAMMVNSGRAGSRQIIPTKILETLQAGASKEQFANSIDAQGTFADGHWSYRAQWWIRQTPGKESINALGINGQWITLDLKREIAIIRQSSQPAAVDASFDDYMINAVDAIVAHLKFKR
jgi:hypothetical protein